jgi:hypothetical protein
MTIAFMRERSPAGRHASDSLAAVPIPAALGEPAIAFMAKGSPGGSNPRDRGVAVAIARRWLPQRQKRSFAP